MSQRIQGKKVAILATDGFEESELFEPKRLLDEAGAQTVILSTKPGEIKGWRHTQWGESAKVDEIVSRVTPEDFDGLLLPGGVMNPDRLRMDLTAVSFVKKMFEVGKPIGAICHGPWMLVEADVVRGRKVTSYPSIRKDLENAGAVWVNEEVVVDSGLVTSRRPDDIPAFSRKLIEEIHEGRHVGRARAYVK